MASNLGYRGVRVVNDNTIYEDDYVFSSINPDFFTETLSGSYINIVARQEYSTDQAEYAITKEVDVLPSTNYGISFKENAYPDGDWYAGELASKNNFKVQIIESYSDIFSSDKTTDLFLYDELVSENIQSKHKIFQTDTQTKKIKIKFYCLSNFSIHPTDGFAVFNISDILIDEQLTERSWTTNENEIDKGSIQLTRSDIKIFDNENSNILTMINKGGVRTNNLIVNSKTLLDLTYPVGSIYISVSSINPSSLFGGTWSAFATGRTLVGIDATDTEFDTIGETGGAKTHTLSTAEMPSHNHGALVEGQGGASAFALAVKNPSAAGAFNLNYINTNGSGSAHNNLQPYIVVYMWKRTA